jgi:catechol 2,3-dioxygenase
MGTVRLIAADSDLLRAYYERAIGLRTLDTSGDTVALGAGDRPLVELMSRPDAPPRPPGTTGLFHLAILVPSRPDLARALRRVLDAGARFTGASDHIVSEALYLRDPEGNGIEIYRDRPREEWTWSAGEVAMDTLPLDFEGVMSELAAGEPPPNGMPDGTVMGHVHLNVSDLGTAEDFYSRALGFDVTVRSYPGALFVSAGAYHHHLGLNTWSGPGAPSPPTGARGLGRFEIVLPAGSSLDEVESRLDRAGAEPVRSEGGLLLSDPSRNRLLLRAQPG